MRWAFLVGASALLPWLAGCSCNSTLGTDRDGGPRTDGGDIRTDGTVPPRDGARPDSGLPPEEIVVFGPGAPADAPDRFAPSPSGDPSGRVAIDYPLDGVLMPRNVYSADVQWSGPGAAGDLYRVRFVGSPVTVTAYVAHSGAGFRDDYLVEWTAWRRLLDLDAGSTLTLTVDRWDSATSTVYASAPVRVRVSRASIAGAVYYWTLGDFGGTQGRILRVRQGTDAPPVIENFMPSPPAGPDGDRCGACHMLSRDGNRLAVSLDDGTFGGVFDLTTDLTATDPPAEFLFSQSWFFAAWSPDGSRLLMTDDSQRTFLLDGATGAPIAPASGTFASSTHPAWSPDGTQVAFIAGADDAWNPSAGNLVTHAVTGADAFGARTEIHSGAALAGAPEGGSQDMYPSYSPDSQYIAFQHGAGGSVASQSTATGAIYVIARDGGEPVRLDNASVGNSWYPSFTPFETSDDEFSGVYWLLFYSVRDYGNALAGTRGTRRRQIWVSAVSADPLGGPDPSNVPYWLPGQATGDHNASAYWAPVPCRATGDDCTTDAQCCGGRCEGGTCMPPEVCRMTGETCTEDADCCTPGLACAGGLCVPAPI